MSKIFYLTLIIFFSFPLFQMLDNGGLSIEFSKIVSPFIYSITTAFCLIYPRIKEYMLIISLTLMVLMVIFYLSGIMNFAEWTGNLGFGTFFITIFSYLPEIFRKGYIERY